MDTAKQTRIADKAKTMTVGELYYSMMDCAKTATAMDAIDRIQGGDRAGKYRDEASIYRVEMNRRPDGPTDGAED